MKVSLSCLPGYSLLFLCLLLSSNNVLSSTASGCVSGNCVDGFGEYRYCSGDSYTGFWKNGIRYGRGTYRFADGSRFVGNYANDRRHGAGKYTSVDGQEIRGSWMYGRFINPKRLESLSGRGSIFATSTVTNTNNSTSPALKPSTATVVNMNNPIAQTLMKSPTPTIKLSNIEQLPKLDELLYRNKPTPDEKTVLKTEAMQLIRACTGYNDETIKELSYLHSVRRNDFDELYFKLRAYSAGSYQRLPGVLEIVLKLKKYHSGIYEQGIDVGRYYWGDCKEETV